MRCVFLATCSVCETAHIGTDFGRTFISGNRNELVRVWLFVPGFSACGTTQWLSPYCGCTARPAALLDLLGLAVLT
jgi:hypothetical protein